MATILYCYNRASDDLSSLSILVILALSDHLTELSPMLYDEHMNSVFSAKGSNKLLV
jgi:hypothetical protein